ncbi:hypothetical protein FOCC_FOCC004282 [Frankliniella occidentalis]|nr:hypothetical protein FOCC_FOCC004282 [Frankliniella occidentalis]
MCFVFSIEESGIRHISKISFSLPEENLKQPKMAFTKLQQWLLALATFSGFWATLVAKAAQPQHFLHKHEFLVLALPVILIGLFGIYAVFTVLYRVFTFNNCEEAAEELNKQIKQARKDLTSKGFSFEKVK